MQSNKLSSQKTKKATAKQAKSAPEMQTMANEPATKPRDKKSSATKKNKLPESKAAGRAKSHRKLSSAIVVENAPVMVKSNDRKPAAIVEHAHIELAPEMVIAELKLSVLHLSVEAGPVGDDAVAVQRSGQDKPSQQSAAEVHVTAEAIAELAYSYWEGRGYQNGWQQGDSPQRDWLRAERELRTAK